MNIETELAAAYERGRRDAFLEAAQIARMHRPTVECRGGNAMRRVANRIALRLEDRAASGTPTLADGTLGICPVVRLSETEVGA